MSKAVYYGKIRLSCLMEDNKIATVRRDVNFSRNFGNEQFFLFFRQTIDHNLCEFFNKFLVGRLNRNVYD